MPPKIPAVPTTGVWYRHVRAGGPPMPGRPAPDGRWQRGEVLAGLYLAEDPETVWAEWYRALAELGVPPETWLPRDLWRFSLNLQRVADLSRRAAVGALGLPDSKPDRAQWPAFQEAGAQLAADGFDGVLFRSSARPAGLCVCAFGSGECFAGVRPVGSAERLDAAPVPPRGMRT
jgi:hypothetical protein